MLTAIGIVRLILIPFLFLFLPCGAIAQAPFAEESKQQSDLRETIFRYMFDRYNYGPSVKVFCIQPERFLTERFLLRFSDVKPPVIWTSDCELAGPMNAVKRRKSGEHGVRMVIEDIRWISARQAEAKVEAFSDGIAANSNILRLAFEEGQWHVKNDKLIGVS